MDEKTMNDLMKLNNKGKELVDVINLASEAAHKYTELVGDKTTDKAALCFAIATSGIALIPAFSKFIEEMTALASLKDKITRDAKDFMNTSEAKVLMQKKQGGEN